MLTLRPYQQAAITSIYDYFQNHKGNPLVVIPTAGGKSLVMAAFIEGVLKAWPDQRILIVTHVRELIAQNHAEMIGLQRQVRIVFDVDIDRRDSAAHDPDAAVRPGGPSGDLHFGGATLSMAVPFRVFRPCPTLEAARLLRARPDGQDGIAIGDEPRAEALHEGCVSHQKGTSGVMASRRYGPWPQAHAGDRNIR